jgi:peptidoglycan glycosyltransferase
LHRPRIGHNVRVTIDSTLQRELAARLTPPGAAVILTIPDGAILALNSRPSYDPNTLDQDWKQLSTDPDAPLLNRATQGLYQPGAILETIVLADALEAGQAALTQTVTRPDQPIGMDNLVLECAHLGEVMQTLADAYANACPTPFADLGVKLGDQQLISMTQRWQLEVAPALALRSSTALTPTTPLSTTQALQAFATGQGELTLSPLRAALVAATIGNAGLMPTAYIVQDVQSDDGQWVSYHVANQSSAASRIISPQIARAILGAMRTIDQVAGHGGAAFSGNKQLSWFIGLAPSDRPRYALAVLIETPAGNAATEAEDFGRAALKMLLQQ